VICTPPVVDLYPLANGIKCMFGLVPAVRPRVATGGCALRCRVRFGLSEAGFSASSTWPAFPQKRVNISGVGAPMTDDTKPGLAVWSSEARPRCISAILKSAEQL
jgi:hypothetical protein